MSFSFAEIFRGSKTSSELVAARDAIVLAEFDADVAEAETEVRKLLVDGSDPDVARAEQRVASARRERDRAAARLEALAVRISEVERKETREELEREHARVTKLANDVEKSLRQDYVKAAGQVVALLTRLRNAEQSIYDFNQRLGEAGELAEGLLFVKPIERRIFDFGLSADRVESLLHRTQLRPYRHPNQLHDDSIPCWPPAE